MSGTVYTLAVIAVCSAVTWLTRALPFLLFGNRPLPALIRFLGRVLPSMIMVILVVYCLRNTDFAAAPHGLSELLACLSVIVLQRWKGNMYLSIVVGTAVYMLLIRLL